MGGFCTDVGFMHNTWTRVTVETEAILFLAVNGHFVDIRDDSIRDKSKADLLAKGLVLFQVLWLVGQAIERKATGYPITLLELHTLVHVACAVCMFSLWFYKPFDVRDPTDINPSEDEKVQECIAVLLLFSLPINGQVGHEPPTGFVWDTIEADSLSWQGHLAKPRWTSTRYQSFICSGRPTYRKRGWSRGADHFERTTGKCHNILSNRKTYKQWRLFRIQHQKDISS